MARNLYVAIMAGGPGERFWPKSTPERPKQFLALTDEETLLQKAYRRATEVTSPDRVLVVTLGRYAGLVREQLPDLPGANIIREPLGRDTAPAVALAAAAIDRRDPDALMLVKPADHVIEDLVGFARATAGAVRAAEEGYLVTYGVIPTRPETGYGYVELAPGGTIDTIDAARGYAPALRFVEKPPLDVAERFVAGRRHLWNSGMFLWRLVALKEAIEKHSPALKEGLAELGRVPDLGDEQALAGIYGRFPKRSIDFEVMEKVDNLAVVPASFDWDDVGSWAALKRHHPWTEAGNVAVGPVTAVETGDSLIFSDGP
ncbi:MAG: mannose-1-phosphate guanylyltransferase, partial [Bacillota bacterium]